MDGDEVAGYVEIHCREAAEFIENLRPRNPIWAGPNGSWIYRGQRDSTWGLTPSALRPTFAGYSKGNRAETQIDNERDAVLEFVIESDRAGLNVPGDSYLCRTRLNRKKGLIGTEEWPSRETMETVAIAQHHGVPTRLLDFTRHPLVAAFFAAKGAYYADPNDPAEEFAVWALNLPFLNFLNKHGLPEFPGSLNFLTVEVPHLDNEFLHAPRGLFLLDAGLCGEWHGKAPEQLTDIKERLFRLLPRAICNWRRENPHVIDVMVKITLERTKSEEVLRCLDRGGINRAVLMPSYRNVLKLLEFRRETGTKTDYAGVGQEFPF